MLGIREREVSARPAPVVNALTKAARAQARREDRQDHSAHRRTGPRAPGQYRHVNPGRLEKVKIGCHTFRATGITAYLEAGGTLENAQVMAAHESPRTTKLSDRTGDEITLPPAWPRARSRLLPAIRVPTRVLPARQRARNAPPSLEVSQNLEASPH
jgi:integrase